MGPRPRGDDRGEDRASKTCSRICDALGLGLIGPAIFRADAVPALDAFLLALDHLWRNVEERRPQWARLDIARERDADLRRGLAPRHVGLARHRRREVK